MPSLEVSGLSVRYGGIRAVESVDLVVDDGEILVVLGANGAGKSSMLRAIVGLEKASAGTVTWDGQDITNIPAHQIARKGIAFVPEGRRILASLSVEENLMLGAHTQRSKQERDDNIARIYDMFPILLERRSGKAGLLSGGEQQMLAFGRALMASPKLMLMDEPSMGLAPAVISIVVRAVRQVTDLGIGVLMVEQNASVAFDLAEQAVVLERGEVVLRGTSEELRSDPTVVRAFLGERAVAERE